MRSPELTSQTEFVAKIYFRHKILNKTTLSASHAGTDNEMTLEWPFNTQKPTCTHAKINVLYMW